MFTTLKYFGSYSR